MGGGGFEPPKQFAADLQSVPFGHSGNRPYAVVQVQDLHAEHLNFVNILFGKRRKFSLLLRTVIDYK